ncbi:metal-sulfur cluster assembly factor [Gelidibacter salicanalis]|uniref:Metal-sulfur cluster assembly factor n=1 Tax=Gelidibacter salicanalis TaxID=291193 RepID=A0A934KX65_9FLAO|nr:metal-sulfur cluster assembly factor [Gelidibacter salicanalis]MBJ7881963.1 metal-sulfur cluster assembly factor [Gelidibacter salicanalis]
MNIKTNNPEKNELAITALYEVMDPEIDLNIVDLGLVYETDFKEESNDVIVIMTLTTRFCPMGESIVESATQAMQQSFPEDKIQVKLSFEPPWDQSMISEAGQSFLNT